MPLRSFFRNKLIRLLFLDYFLLLLLGGCAYTSHYDQLMTLKQLGEEGDEIQNYVKGQEKSFIELKDDIKNNRLKKGMPKREVFSQYGEPILCEKYENKANVKEFCLYRLPTRYFDTDRAFLFFDKKGRLDSWEFIPASKN